MCRSDPLCFSLKLGAFHFFYLAIVATGLEKPHSLLFRNLKKNEEALKGALEEAQRLANTDPLTGLHSRRHFFALAEKEMERACRYRRPISAIMLDIDHFKLLNDTNGHVVGDHVLQGVAECCRQGLRLSDVAGRYGGDEFVVILPECDLDEAGMVAGRLQWNIERKMGDFARGVENITASLGVAAIDWQNPTLANLLERADQALYSSKQSGRNMISMA